MTVAQFNPDKGVFSTMDDKSVTGASYINFFNEQEAERGFDS